VYKMHSYLKNKYSLRILVPSGPQRSANLSKCANISAKPATLIGHFSVSSTLKMEPAGSYKMLIHTTTCHHISEYRNLHTHLCKNLNTRILSLFTSQTFAVKKKRDVFRGCILWK
jgi:hypothetical protein